jgi:hypothetical protein
MSNLGVLRLAFLLLSVLLVSIEIMQAHRKGKPDNLARTVLGVVAAVNILFFVFLWVNHINFPLNLDLMEGTVLQHFRLASQSQPIYPAPTPEYVPLAYNVLYYIVSIPFGWVFGQNLFTLRLVAILATLGSGVILYRVVRENTLSRWWGLIAVGLFSAGYRVMETYLDNAHSDSALLFAALLGSYILYVNRSRRWNLIGVVVLVAAFWFKQHGALFTVGGVLFLTWREGWKKALLYWFVAAVLGPILYAVGGPLLFGSNFLYFTWEVPRDWSQLDLATFRRYFVFILRSYPILALSSIVVTAWTAIRDRRQLTIWHVQLVFAMLTGLMGSLDSGSADNVYIPMGVWFILVGTLGLYELSKRIPTIQRFRVHLIGLFITFIIFFYNPLDVIVSPEANVSYADLVAVLDNLHGQVYAPSLGQLQDGYMI